MLKSRLILFEGLPGSGKTTSARKLAEEIARAGTACQDFYEWSRPHPIDIGDFEHLGDYIAGAAERDADLERQWEQFARRQSGQDTVTVMESRYWQTTAMLMLAGGRAEEEIIAHNRRVIAAIAELQPALIYFTTNDVKAALERTIRIKNDEWRRDGREDTWAERIFEILKPQRWFAGRDPRDLLETSDFFEHWTRLAEKLYDQAPFAKMKLCDPYIDWEQSMGKIRSFLDLPPQAARRG